ncbi:MAG: M23 family metallopeptidase [Actinobacteria bacterium]|nr:M23 family metallopeptidase [Actinomycetota bacterium]
MPVTIMIVAVLFPVLASPARADEIRPIRFPIEGRSRFSNDFGAPRSGGRSHQGNDIFASKLQQVVAVVDAKISLARLDSSGNAGNIVVLRDAQGWEYSYMHLNNDSPGTDDGANMAEWAMAPGLRQGSRVVAGQPIAYVGDSGNAEGTAPHLHFEIHAPDDSVLNPFESLQAASREPFANNHPGAASPAGSIDLVDRAPGGIRISGWSIDPDTTGPVTVMAYPNGRWGGEAKASKERGDLATAYPTSGSRHGFSMLVPVSDPGRVTTCVYGANVEAGLAGRLGCPSLDVAVNPFGSIDQVDRQPGGVNVSGWVIDPDVAESTDVHVYVDGAFAGSSGGAIERSDVASAFPAYGSAHGFSLDLTVSEGFHVMCAYGINVASGQNSLIGCRWIMNTTDPWSNLDRAERQGSVITVAGWATDPDTRAPVPLHTYLDGIHVGLAGADIPRPDLPAAYPRYGERHGFGFDLPVNSAPHTVCVYAINEGPGHNTLVGCRTV